MCCGCGANRKQGLNDGMEELVGGGRRKSRKMRQLIAVDLLTRHLTLPLDFRGLRELKFLISLLLTPYSGINTVVGTKTVWLGLGKDHSSG